MVQFSRISPNGHHHHQHYEYESLRASAAADMLVASGSSESTTGDAAAAKALLDVAAGRAGVDATVTAALNATERALRVQWGTYFPDVAPTIALYFLSFALAGALCQRYCYTDSARFNKFKQFRLRNITVALCHSIVVGAAALWAFVAAPYEMFGDMISYRTLLLEHLPLASVGYFMHDAMDMMRFECHSRYTREMLIHHAASIFVLLAAGIPKIFLPYAAAALVMECNSVFLHLRAIYRLLDWDDTTDERWWSAYALIRRLNVATFVLFRFGVQAYQIPWAIANRHHIHGLYLAVGTVGGAGFLFINWLLFKRLMVSDGYWQTDAPPEDVGEGAKPPVMTSAAAAKKQG